MADVQLDQSELDSILDDVEAMTDEELEAQAKELIVKQRNQTEQRAKYNASLSPEDKEARKKAQAMYNKKRREREQAILKKAAEMGITADTV